MEQKLLPAYNPDIAYPLINHVEYPYSIMEAYNYFSKMNMKCMIGRLGIDDYRRDVNKEKRDRIERLKEVKLWKKIQDPE